MKLESWSRAVVDDATSRQIQGLAGLVDTLAQALAALREADWNDDPAGMFSSPDGASAAPAVHMGAGIGTTNVEVSTSPVASRAPAEPANAHRLSIEQMSHLIASGRTSASDLVERCLAEISAHNPSLNAFITVAADRARLAARQADKEIASGRIRGPLHGIPISVKDLVDVAGMATTAASRVRRGHVAADDAPVVTRVRQAGAVIVGKCNLHEFAFGTTSEESAYGPVKHPLDQSRSPGGSSGGSAAAIVSGMCAASIGTDTGGSIRIPSAACGTVGLKPTFGELSCEGVVPLARTLDHVGPLARTVADAWLLYRVMKGSEPGWPETVVRSPSTIVCGVPRSYFLDHLDDGVRTAFEDACERLQQAGCRVDEVEVPHARLIAPVYLATVFAEAAAVHARGLERQAGDYTEPVRVRFELARYVLGEDYVRAQRGREVLGHEIDRLLEGCTVLLLPTLPVPAPPLGSKTVQMGTVVEATRAATLRLTQVFNLTGHPAISLPAPRTADGLPVGLQLAGRRFETEALLGVARVVEACLC